MTRMTRQSMTAYAAPLCETVIEAPIDRDYLVKRCTEEAIAFLEANRDRPFFCYIPHTMPGSTPHPFSECNRRTAGTATRLRSSTGPRARLWLRSTVSG